jgi:hypothetical protein
MLRHTRAVRAPVVRSNTRPRRLPDGADTYPRAGFVFCFGVFVRCRFQWSHLLLLSLVLVSPSASAA